MNKCLLTLLSLFLLTLVNGQNPVGCQAIKNGIFHIYPKNSSIHYLTSREGENQKEINVGSGDSTMWKIDWKDECSYTLEFISSSEKMEDKVKQFLKKHKFFYEVGKITADYYSYTGYIDNKKGATISVDTVWLSEKAEVVNNELFSATTAKAVQKAHFSDTSQYALLYIYRPYKLTNSLADYLVYFDNIIFFVAKNKTGQIYKLYREGKFRINSKLMKAESEINLDVKFGHKYYIKAGIIWGVQKHLYNFRLEMEAMDAQKGEAEFLEVRTSG